MGANRAMSLSPGDVIGGHRIEGVIGQGGMGVVYRATDLALNRTVALKVIAGPFANDPSFRERFKRESITAASIRHPNVIPIFHAGEESGLLFITMLYVAGTDLRQVITTDGALYPPAAAAIVAQVAGALDAAHRHGLVHRDVKPANILIESQNGDQQAYLTDFGLTKRMAAEAASLTNVGTFVGTLDYCAPEQLQGQHVDARTDIYALGCVLYHALTGRVPFPRDSEPAKIWAHMSEQPPPMHAVAPYLAPACEQVVRRAMAKDPNQRYPSASDLGRAAIAAVSNQPVEAGNRTASTGSTAPEEGTTADAAPQAAAVAGTTAPFINRTGSPPIPDPRQRMPVPAARTGARSGNQLALIVLGLVALAGVAVGALAAGGIFSHQTSTQTITSASSSRQPARQATASPTPTQSTTAPAAGSTSCGGDLSVGPNTSCPFAQNVEHAYDQTSGGDQTVTAYSPATGQTYTINCTGGSPHVCTGGTTQNASVYFTSGPSSGTSSPASGIPSGTTPCQGDVFVGPNTSCSFAENVEAAYRATPGGDQDVTAYSPATGTDYVIHCTGGSPHTCNGGTTNNASVYFP